MLNLMRLCKLSYIITVTLKLRLYTHLTCVSRVCNETDAQLVMPKYKKNTMKRKRRALYRDEKVKCFSLRVLVSN